MFHKINKIQQFDIQYLKTIKLFWEASESTFVITIQLISLQNKQNI
jgi:hypothetical protein